MKTASPKVAKATPRLKLIKPRKASLKLAVVSAEAKAPPHRELTPLQQEALILKYRVKARKLGRSMLRRWHSRMDLEEVDSVVDLSLCEAVKRFDPHKGASFMTFLFYHLKGNLVRAVAAAAASSSIPLAIGELEEAGKSIGEINFVHGISGVNSAEIAEAVTSQDAPLPDEALWRKQLSDRSTSACEKLDSLEREIIKRLFVHEQQIIDIAAALGYSRCHISRIKKKALDTLHDELRVVMNQDDYGMIEESVSDPLEHVRHRISNRREIHRRRPRAQGRRDVEIVDAKAA